MLAPGIRYEFHAQTQPAQLGVLTVQCTEQIGAPARMSEHQSLVVDCSCVQIDGAGWASSKPLIFSLLAGRLRPLIDVASTTEDRIW